jgi:hypothetical protein
MNLLPFACCLVATAGSIMAAEVALTPLKPREPAPAGAKPFERLDPAAAGLTVANVFDDPRMWGERFRELTLGAVETGVAVADFNGDGRPDIFMVSKNGPCALYWQVGDMVFSEGAAAAGVAVAGAPSSNNGVTVVDLNQDGRPDLYLCRYDLPNLLFVNRGDGTFEERAADYGLAIRDASVHATFADYDRDGDLDAYLTTNILDFSKSPQGRRDLLLRNDGPAGFAEVGAAAGIWGLTQGHTAIWFDANHDGWPDLYVANDFETPDRFYLNRGDGTFADVVDERLPHVTYFSMGADSGDLNNDGLVDFMITDMRDRTHREYMTGMEEIGRGLWEMERVSTLIPQYMWNAVYLNTGTDRYTEAAHLLGMEATGWTWATRFADLDNDGRLDVFVTAGMIRNFIDADLVDRQNVAPTLEARAAVWRGAAPRRERTLLYRNVGDLAMKDVSGDWGVDEDTVAFAAVPADLDGDGDLDIVYANLNAPPTVVRNRTDSGHRALVRLRGLAPNRDGIGAEIRLTTASGGQVRQVYTERGIASGEAAVVHFGLGRDTRIERLEVRWPRGAVTVLSDLPADHEFVVSEPAEAPAGGLPPARLHEPPRADALFAESAAARGLRHENALRPFDELIRQRLLPRRLHGQAPALASADVNGDGRADLFVSGGAGQAGVLFFADDRGGFQVASGQPWTEAAAADDTGAVFFDADGDGDADLFVVAGGVHHGAASPWLQDRLYLNDGAGSFRLAPDDAVPSENDSGTAVAAADFDGDGAIDLFVGGRVVPGRYPDVPRSALLRNVGGRFADVTDEIAPALRNVGLVTAASWGDLDGDGRPELAVATEWGAVRVFGREGGRLVERTASAGLADVTGWWCALTIADVNGDGRADLIAGNHGLNTKYRASPQAPVRLYAGASDGSGAPQLVEARLDGDRWVPWRGRSKLGYSFPNVTRRYPTFRAFAEASVDDLFGDRWLGRARVLETVEMASGVFVQAPDGRFSFRAFPREAQLAPLNAMVAADFDGDGNVDLLAAGNSHAPEPTTGRFDGGVGVVLKGDGRGGFTALSPAEAGVVATGEVRAAALLADAAGLRVVVARNEGSLLLFEKR